MLKRIKRCGNRRTPTLITNGPVVLSGRTNLISHIPTGAQKIKIEITGLSNSYECKPLYCRQFCPELEFISPPDAIGSYF